MAELDASGLGNSVPLIKMLARIGAERESAGEKGPALATSKLSPAAARRRIAELTRAGEPYWNPTHAQHAKAVEHVSRLYRQAYP